MLVCAHMCACICKRFINYVNVLACLSSCIWCRRSRTRSVVQHFIHMAAVLSWASSRVRVLWEDAPVELDHTFTITSFLCHSQYMKILTLEHHARLDIDPYLSGWGKKKKGSRYKPLSRHLIWYLDQYLSSLVTPVGFSVMRLSAVG